MAGSPASTPSRRPRSATTPWRCARPEDADSARAQVRALLRQPLTADRAVQIALLEQSRSAGGLQRARHRRGRAWCRRACRPIRPSRVERLAGGGEIEIEAPHRREHPRARDAAGARRDRRRTVSARRSCAPPRRRCASPPTPAAPTTARSRRASWSASSRRRSEPARPRRSSRKRLGETGAMNKLDQAREQVFYAEIAGAARDRPPARGQRARAAGPRARPVGRRSRFQAARRAAAAAARVPRRSPSVEVEAVRRRVDLQIARIEVDALAKSYGLTGATRFVNLLEVAGIAKTADARDRRDASASAASRSSSRCRCSTSARSGCGRPSRPTCRRSTGSPRRRSTCAREARDAYRRYRSTYDIARHYRARGAAAAQDHLGRNAAALQRDADRRVRAAGRGAPAHRRDHRGDRGASAISGSPKPISAPRCRRRRGRGFRRSQPRRRRAEAPAGH